MLLRLTLLLSLCATVFFLLPHRPVQGAVENPAVENHLVGDAACVRCHAQVSGTYAHTSHHLTSQLPSRATILGSFQPPANVLVISAPSGPASSEEPRLSFKMEARTDGFYQTAQADLGEQHLTRSERFDVVVGNGTRGQTYLYWKQDGLFELPVSFWSTGSQWIPGWDGELRASCRRPVPGMSCNLREGPVCRSTVEYVRPRQPEAWDFLRELPRPGRRACRSAERGPRSRRSHDPESGPLSTRSTDRSMRALPQWHGPSGACASLQLCSGAGALALSRPQWRRSGRLARRAWQPGWTIEAQRLLSRIARDDLLHLP
jgi:hypothetical protein